MTNRKTEHDKFMIERRLSHPPARVFKAWADPAAKAAWFRGPAGWEQKDREMDFRVGGRESLAGGPKGGPLHIFRSRYEEIVPNERIVTTYTMHENDALRSVSLATVELFADGSGTRLVYTEQGVFLDGTDWVQSREAGTKDLLDKLEKSLAG